MNVLFFIEDFYSGSGECIKSLSKELIHRNDKAFVLTKSAVCETSHEYTTYSLNTTIFRRLQGSHLSSFLNKLKILFYCPIWPFKSICTAYQFYCYSKKIIQKDNIDVVVSVYNSIESIFAGYLLKYRFGERIKFVPYFLDAFYAGQKLSFMSEKQKKRKCLFWEKKLLSNADKVIMMEPAMISYEKDNISPPYLKYTEFLDLPLYNPQLGTNSTTKKPNPSPIIVFVGSMPNNIRNPKAIIDIISKLQGIDYKLELIGSSDYLSYLEMIASGDKRIKIEGVVSHDEALAKIHNADFLLNIGNSLSYMVPCKIFEYMSYGKPIISSYRIDDDPCLPYLSKYDNCLLIDEREDEKDNILKLKEFIIDCMNTTRTSSPNIELFHNNTPSAFCDLVSSLFVVKQ